jgi:hypothetical protein
MTLQETPSKYNTSFAQQQAELCVRNSDEPASILAGTISSIAYVSLSTLVGKSTAHKLVAKAAAYADTSTAPYKKTLQQQVAFLKQYPEVVSQVELIGLNPSGTTSNRTYTSFATAQRHLLSHGSIHINSSKATDYPVINPSYFSVPFDVKVSTAGTACCRKIAATPLFAGTEVYPGQGVDLQNYNHHWVYRSEFHPIGTASMLPRLNIRHCKRPCRRIPLHISAHTQGTVYDIAEQADDIILNGH